MNPKFTSLLAQNAIQVKYIRAIFEKRPDNKEELMQIPLREVFKGAQQEISLRKLLLHAMRPLYATCEILEEPSLNFDDVELKGEKLLTIAEILNYYENLINRTEKLFNSIEISQLKGEFKGLEEAEIFRRFTIMCFHAVHHFSQVIRLHGLITEMKITNQK